MFRWITIRWPKVMFWTMFSFFVTRAAIKRIRK
jgi:hypothetical protein